MILKFALGKNLLPLVLFAVSWLFLVPFSAFSQAEPESGPEPGGEVPALPVFAVTGPEAEHDVDYAQVRAERPTVYVFIDQARWGRPAGRFLRELDTKLREQTADVAVIVVWLTSDVDAAKAYLPKVQMSLRLADTALTVFTGDGAGPEGWAINDQADLTAVVAYKKKVSARWGFVSVNETVVPEVLTALKLAAAK